jgi:hypothetical protein
LYAVYAARLPKSPLSRPQIFPAKHLLLKEYEFLLGFVWQLVLVFRVRDERVPVVFEQLFSPLQLSLQVNLFPKKSVLKSRFWERQLFFF